MKNDREILHFKQNTLVHKLDKEYSRRKVEINWIPKPVTTATPQIREYFVSIPEGMLLDMTQGEPRDITSMSDKDWIDLYRGEEKKRQYYQTPLYRTNSKGEKYLTSRDVKVNGDPIDKIVYTLPPHINNALKLLENNRPDIAKRYWKAKLIQFGKELQELLPGWDIPFLGAHMEEVGHFEAHVSRFHVEGNRCTLVKNQFKPEKINKKGRPLTYEMLHYDFIALFRYEQLGKELGITIVPEKVLEYPREELKRMREEHGTIPDYDVAMCMDDVFKKELVHGIQPKVLRQEGLKWAKYYMEDLSETSVGALEVERTKRENAEKELREMKEKALKVAEIAKERGEKLEKYKQAILKQQEIIEKLRKELRHYNEMNEITKEILKKQEGMSI